MRKLLVLLCSLAAFTAGLAPAAQAEDSTVPISSLQVVEDRLYNPNGFWCDVVPGSSTGNVYYAIEADAPAPPAGLGARVWGHTFVAHTGTFHGAYADVPSAADLDTFEIQVYGTTAGSGRARVFAWTASADTLWEGTAVIGGAGDSWSTVDASALTYTWTERYAGHHPTTPWQPTATEPVAGTIEQFTATHPGADGYTAAIGFGCEGDGFFFDGFRWGAAGNVTTLDFEALSSVLTIDATKTTIVAGKPTSITGMTSVHYVPSTPVDLEVKAFGSDTWTLVDTVQAPEDLGWALTKKVAPLKQARYRWHFLGTEVEAETFSPEVVVKVKTAITASLADSTLNRGQNLVASGKTTPKKPGATVTLWRRTPNGPVELATTTVKGDGTYRVVHEVNRAGTWKVFTTIPAGSGNLAGTSPIRTAEVS